MTTRSHDDTPLDAPFPLRRRFVLLVLPLLLLLVAAVVVSTGYAARVVVRSIYLDIATHRAAGIVDGVARLAPGPWTGLIAGRPLTAADRTRLESAFADEVQEFRLTRLKVYDLAGRTVFDTDRRQIGKVETNPALRAVIQDGTARAIPETAPDGSRLYELYVPYRRGDRVAAVLELYEPVGFLDGILFRSGIAATIAPAALLVLLVVVLLLLVRRAQADIDRRTGLVVALRQRLESLVSRGAVRAVRAEADAVAPQRIECTLMFTDVRSFTEFAEARDPEAVIAFLDRLMALQVDLVERWGGDVDKLVGDGLFARFEGAGERDTTTAPDARAARRAVGCALAIQRDAARAGLPLDLGIGVFTGPVIAGTIGAAGRRDYTVVGDSVNVAARLCALAGRCEVVVDAATARASGLAGDARATPASLKGRRGEISVVRLKASAG